MSVILVRGILVTPGLYLAQHPLVGVGAGMSRVRIRRERVHDICL